MTTPGRPKLHVLGKGTPYSNVVLPRLHAHLDEERATLGRLQQRLLRVHRRWLKQLRCLAPLARRIGKPVAA